MKLAGLTLMTRSHYNQCLGLNMFVLADCCFQSHIWLNILAVMLMSPEYDLNVHSHVNCLE